MASFVNRQEGFWKLILKKNTHAHTHIIMVPALGTIIISKQATNTVTENQTKEREMGEDEDEEETMEFGNRRRTWYKIMGQ
jgi:hypothetical protein